MGPALKRKARFPGSPDPRRVSVIFDERARKVWEFCSNMESRSFGIRYLDLNENLYFARRVLIFWTVQFLRFASF